MEASKYVDTSAILQVIGCIFNELTLLDCKDKYTFNQEDFPNEFHRTVFGTIYNLYQNGASKITLENIEDYLSVRPKAYEIYQRNKGAEWLSKVSENSNLDSFNYYYGRLKKFSLLRAYTCYNIDVSDIYDPDNILDIKKKQAQEDFLDNSSLEDIADIIDKKIDDIRLRYVENCVTEAYQAGEGIVELVQKLKEVPDVGVPLYGNLINTVTRGARLGKFYMRSAASGVGKTRSLAADAAYISCNKIYDETFGWIKNGISMPTLFIATEQDLSEIQTMLLAFLSNVNEEHILQGYYEGDEEDRVLEACEILKQSPLYVEVIPDFSLQDIENCIKKNIRDNDVKYVFYDYIHSSMKILEEITQRSGGIKLREDNVLFMLSSKLKEICVKYNVFIMTSTQLNGDWKESESPDQNLLRGAKSIADRLDYGAILLNTTQKDIESLQTILSSNLCFDEPTIKLSVYKNRRGRWKSIYLWCKADLGTCRVQPMFATTYNYELIKMDNLQITIEEGAFEA